MKKWLEFNLKNPKLMLLVLVVITIPMFWGVARLQFNSSIEVLMPASDPLYRMGQFVKKSFGDNKTFTIISIESRSNKQKHNNSSTKTSALRPEIFEHIAPLFYELEEYSEFDKNREDRRLQNLLQLVRVKAQKEQTPPSQEHGKEQKKIAQKPAANEDTTSTRQAVQGEDSLDQQILGGGSSKSPSGPSTNKKKSSKVETSTDKPNNRPSNTPSVTGESGLDEAILGDSQAKQNNKQDNKKKNNKGRNGSQKKDSQKKDRKKTANNNNLLKINDWPESARKESFAQAIRERRSYDYSDVRRVTIAQIRQSLDPIGQKQLDTVLTFHGMDDLEPGRKLSRQNIQNIVESWETIYLYKSKEIIKDLSDPVTVEDITSDKGALAARPILPEQPNGHHRLPRSDEDFAQYMSKLRQNPLFASALYHENEQGRVTALGANFVLRPQEDHTRIREYMWHLIQKYDNGPVRVHTMGSMIFNKFMSDFTRRDLSLFLPLVILVVILTFYFNFRSVRGVLLPTMTVLISTLWTMGTMGFWGIPLTIIGSIIPTLLIAVGSSYAIHIFNQYMLELSTISEEDKKQALLGTLNHISTTVMLAGVTTFIGFLTLTVNQVQALREFGIFAALGTLFAVFISVVLISASLMLMPVLAQKRQKTSGFEQSNWLVRNIVALFSTLSLDYTKVVVVLSLFGVLLGAWGSTKVTTETTPVRYFMEDSYINRAAKKVGENFNGSFVFDVVIDSGRKNGAKDPDFLRYVNELQEWLGQKHQKEEYHILHSTSFTDVVKRMNQAMHYNREKKYSIPERKITIKEYLEIFSGKDANSDGRADRFETVVDKDYRKVNLMVRLGDHGGESIGSAKLAQARQHIKEHIQNHKDSNKYKYQIVGLPVNFVVLSDYIVEGQIKAIILSIIIVALIVYLLFQNGYAGLVALIPISASVLIVFGIMGFSGIPLDIAQAILSSVAIGIGVDDTIHFLNTLRKKFKEGLSLREGIDATHRETGLAIVYTSLALILGFSVLLFSRFKPVVYFGFLVSSVMVATTLGALVVLPAVIYLFRLPLQRRSQSRLLNRLDIARWLEQDGKDTNDSHK